MFIASKATKLSFKSLCLVHKTGYLFKYGMDCSSRESSSAALVSSEVDSNGVCFINIDRPHKKNAITWDMFEQLTNQIKHSNDRDHVKITVLTGKGDYFTSGIDLSNFSQIPFMNTEEQKDFAQLKKTVAYNVFDAVINHQKLFIVLANGPAIGFGTTILGLSDMAYACDSAFFLTPFVKVGINPEGCSTLTFPSIMGPVAANRLLMLGEKISAVEARRLGLITEVFEREHFESKSLEKIQLMSSKLSYTGLMKVKSAVVDKTRRELLRKRNELECELLGQCFQSQEFKMSMSKIFGK